MILISHLHKVGKLAVEIFKRQKIVDAVEFPFKLLSGELANEL